MGRHEHEWVDDTNYGDHARRYVCISCGTPKSEPYGDVDEEAVPPCRSTPATASV